MSKKFSEIKAELAAKEKITADEFDEAKLAFSELKADDQTAEMQNLLSMEAKIFNDEGGS